MWIFTLILGVLIYSFFKCIAAGFYTVAPNERAVLTSFGRAVRLRNTEEADPSLSEDEQKRYKYPAVKTITPGGPYFKWPWQKVYKVDVATQAIDITWDPTKAQTSIEAVTKDNLTTGVRGQIRYRISENNLYAFVFGVSSPLEHVMGYFISLLRERIANFTDPNSSLVAPTEMEAEDDTSVDLSEGVSINDLRKNLPKLNQYMEEQCRSCGGRYGIELDAALITEIDPPTEVDRALAAINSTRNQVAADISTARADADQQITLSKRAVEIASNNAEAEVAPLLQLAETMSAIKEQGGPAALASYLRNMKIPLIDKAQRIIRTA